MNFVTKVPLSTELLCFTQYSRKHRRLWGLPFGHWGLRATIYLKTQNEIFSRQLPSQRMTEACRDSLCVFWNLEHSTIMQAWRPDCRTVPWGTGRRLLINGLIIIAIDLPKTAGKQPIGSQDLFWSDKCVRFGTKEYWHGPLPTASRNAYLLTVTLSICMSISTDIKCLDQIFTLCGMLIAIHSFGSGCLLPLTRTQGILISRRDTNKQDNP